MKSLIITMVLILPFSSQAKCNFEIKPENVKVKWVAYKTPKKVAVQGEFKKFAFTSTKAEDVIGSLHEATFNIDSSSVSTGNPDRDKKIVNNFFMNNGKSVKISGKFSSKAQAKVTAQLEIQGTSKEVTFATEEKEKSLELSSDINVLDFALKDNLSRINLACKALHEGVTWPDVKIIIEISGMKKCE